MSKQLTLRAPIRGNGCGLHLGQEASFEIHPAAPDSGIVFVRTDLEGEPRIPAVAENVVETARCTEIGVGDARVMLIEHLMSALWSSGVDNAEVRVNGPEIPIFDGSARFFVDELAKVGLEEQDAEREYFTITEPISFSVPERGIELTVLPAETYSVDVLVDYENSVLHSQYASFREGDPYAQEVATARTFCFLDEIEPLLESNLIKGGDLQNALVILRNDTTQDEIDNLAKALGKQTISMPANGIISKLPLQFNNEPTRHKLLDVLGDLSLVGKRFCGKVIARRPGHYANSRLAGKIRTALLGELKAGQAPRINLTQEPVMDVVDIQKMLPHRPPFLLVDKIMELTSSRVIGVKNVTMNEAFFVGHFPGAPVMPGVLQIEAMAQVGGVLVLNTVPDPENYLTYFLRIDNVRFRQKVMPGDTLVFRLYLTAPIRRGIANMHGEIFVGETLVAEGDLMAQISKSK